MGASDRNGRRRPRCRGELAALIVGVAVLVACTAPSPQSAQTATTTPSSDSAPKPSTTSTTAVPPATPATPTTEPPRISEAGLVAFITAHHPAQLPLIQQAQAGKRAQSEPYLDVRPVGDAPCSSCVDLHPAGITVGLPLTDLSQAEALDLCDAIADYTESIDKKLRVMVEYHLHIAELWDGRCR